MHFMEEKKDSPSQDGSSHNPFLIPGAIIIAGILIAGAVFYGNRGSDYAAVQQGVKQGEAPSPPVDPQSVLDSDAVLGDPNAPVTIVEFSDFQCSFCEGFFKEIEPVLRDRYIKTGKVKFMYRDFPFESLHPVAQKAAEAAECAHEQGRFWEYHDVLFTRQKLLSLDNLKRWAAKLKMDSAQFNQCLDSGKYAKEVRDDFSAGVAAGVKGTPSVFVNGYFVEGFRTRETLSAIEALIETSLAGKAR